MIERTVKIIDPCGLHLRPARDFCNQAIRFQSEIYLCFQNREYNVKSLLSVLSACIQQEDEVVIKCSGPDEEEAIEKLTEILKRVRG